MPAVAKTRILLAILWKSLGGKGVAKGKGWKHWVGGVVQWLGGAAGADIPSPQPYLGL